MKYSHSCVSYIVTAALGFVILVPTSAMALSLTRGTPASLSGTLGNVTVNYVSDNPTLAAYLDSTGATPSSNVPVTRVQYDVLNTAGNGTIFDFTVFYPVGTNVLGAMEPAGYYNGAGAQTSWGGIAYTTLFKNGFGVYNYNSAFHGSEWQIDYQPDHVTWSMVPGANGFFQDTASGFTNFGFNPTFNLDFAQGTPLGLQPANVTGRAVTGAPVMASGQVLSAATVPVPAAAWLLGSGLFGLGGFMRKTRRHAATAPA